ncbi:hypothetical protein CEP52_000641 [Fusarium oligoseptatum]|uniref:Uncharacterized protein n=1 Tax=Fusarium oligoseptatum TaxID=2604345 RepID=A0A428UMZ6_9HYPO|nr:hypothetical protein CEP52_000641 [Fusarium oligoseptatum]
MPGTDLEADCAQNIALLYYLGQVASHPHKNLTRHQEAGTAWSISLNDEKHLTTTLGLLSGIKDDIRNVTAVCVEERRPGLVVMVAANAKGPGSSSPYLQWVKEGFDNVFSLLKDASSSSREQRKDDVFRAIVSMCRWRILSRIRMINPENKPTIQKLLREIHAAIEKLPRRTDLEGFLALSNQLLFKLAKYQAAFTPPIGGTWALTRDKELESIVQICYELSDMPTIGIILLKDVSCVKPRVAPNSCEAVLNMIRKVGNYKRAATTLVKLARRYECIRQVTTIAVVLDSSTLAHRTPTQRPSLAAMLDKLKAHHGTSWNTDKVTKELSGYLGSESKCYKSQIDPLMRHPRVHAEMQLIWYLNQHQGPTPPRVIASNKDACYLCNAFIAFHGKYSIPRTHGRIYPGWRLPSSGLQDVKKGFSLELERLAVAKINQILKKGFERIDCPLESTAEALREMAEGSDSDETVVPEHGTETLDPQGQQVEECLSLHQGSPAAQDGSDTQEQTTPDYNEVERSTDPEPLARPSPGSLSRPLSSQEPQQVPEDEYDNADGNSTPKAQAFQPSENLHHPTVETDAGSNPSVASRSSQIVSPETYETRTSSTSTPASLGKKQCKENEVDVKDDAWRQVEKGRQGVVTLPNSLELFVEYTTGSSSKSQNLRFKARQLSEEEVETALNEGVPIHDLTSLGYEEVKVESSGGIMMRVDDQVFVAHLDEFVAPT